MKYLVLGLAIVLEVAGTLQLPRSENFTKFWPTLTIFVSYSLAFYLLTYAVRDMPVAVVYAIWSGLGVFLVTVLGVVLLGQALPWQGVIGLVLIVIGVILVNSFAAPH